MLAQHLIASRGGTPGAAQYPAKALERLLAWRPDAAAIERDANCHYGLFYASQTGTVESTLGQTEVLPGVAAAVVGGVSLFGGRGTLANPVVGALLISMITNGLGLLGLSAGVTFIVQGAVLILAASVDALSRRRAGASLAR